MIEKHALNSRKNKLSAVSLKTALWFYYDDIQHVRAFTGIYLITSQCGVNPYAAGG